MKEREITRRRRYERSLIVSTLPIPFRILQSYVEHIPSVEYLYNDG